MLILLYDLIPGRIYHDKKIGFSILVGLLFSLAGFMGILVPWTGTTHPAIGLNGVLIPLAGYVGGLASAGIITCVILIFKYFFEGGVVVSPDLVIALVAALVGSAFHLARKRNLSIIPPILEVFLLSTLFSGITMIVLRLMLPEPGPNSSYGYLQQINTGGIIFVGLFLLGIVILQIDQKKENEQQLVRYQGHLKALVQERTAELIEINALQYATIESTADGIVVIDLDQNVIANNITAQHVLDIRPATEMQEENLNVVRLIRYHLADPDTFQDYLLSLLPVHEHVLSTELTFRSGRIYELYITPYLVREEIRGRVLNFRDITEKMHAKEMLVSVNQKLLLLSGITRHDILNQITALKLYVYLIRTNPGDPQTPEYLDRMSRTLMLMQQHTESTGDYQDIGIHEPIWQRPDQVFLKTSGSFADRGVTFSSPEMTSEIFADPLVERVFYNLIDNSIRHGGKVTAITLTLRGDEDHALLIYEDNGNGIPPEEKEKIFNKGFGKHTGFGMFLIHEILSITGITISETGILGSGARFELLIPADAIRPVCDEPV